MTDDRDEALFQRAAAAVRVPGSRDVAALEDVLAAVRGEATHDSDAAAALPAMRRLRGRGSRVWTRGAMRFAAGLAAGLAFAAGLGIGLAAGWRMRGDSYRLAAEDARLHSAASTALAEAATRVEVTPAALRPVQFMLVAPTATRVSLVGEFNDWDPAATPMTRAPGGAWHVALPLARGRHVYAFVVDGTAWVADPQAPLAPERWFGARNSVLVVDPSSGGRVQ